MTRTSRPTKPQLLPPPASTSERPYLSEDRSLTTYIEEQRTAAQRTMADLQAEIEAFTVEIERRNSDTATANSRDEVEIAARRQRLDDLAITVLRCDAALAIDVTPNRAEPE